MKKFKIQILTPEGIKIIRYDQAKQNLKKIEQSAVKKYGTFIMLKAEEIK